MGGEGLNKIIKAIDRLTDAVKESSNTDFIKLLEMKFKIIEMKSDHYNWSCHIPQETKDQLEEMLLKIEDALKLIEVARNIIDEQQYC